MTHGEMTHDEFIEAVSLELERLIANCFVWLGDMPEVNVNRPWKVIEELEDVLCRLIGTSDFDKFKRRLGGVDKL